MTSSVDSRKRLKVLLIGEEAAGIQALKLLARRGESIAGVMATAGKRLNGVASLAAVAHEFGYPVWPAACAKDPRFGERLQERGVDLLLNVHSLFVIHPKVLAAARIGAYNLHPGPLPHYAGLNTISWAIYQGESEFGVSLHEMTATIDAGPIAYQAHFPLSEEDTAVSLMAKCTAAGIPLLNQLLESAASNPASIPRIHQDPSKRRYYGREVPEGGRLRWCQPARLVVDFVRACAYDPFPSPWGYPRARYLHQEMEILKARRTGFACATLPGTVASVGEIHAIVACSDEWISLRRLRVDNRAVAPASILSPGTRLQDGSALPAKIQPDKLSRTEDNANPHPAIY